MKSTTLRMHTSQRTTQRTLHRIWLPLSPVRPSLTLAPRQVVLLPAQLQTTTLLAEADRSTTVLHCSKRKRPEPLGRSPPPGSAFGSHRRRNGTHFLLSFSLTHPHCARCLSLSLFRSAAAACTAPLPPFFQSPASPAPLLPLPLPWRVVFFLPSSYLRRGTVA